MHFHIVCILFTYSPETLNLLQNNKHEGDKFLFLVKRADTAEAIWPIVLPLRNFV